MMMRSLQYWLNFKDKEQLSIKPLRALQVFWPCVEANDSAKTPIQSGTLINKSRVWETVQQIRTKHNKKLKIFCIANSRKKCDAWFPLL